MYNGDQLWGSWWKGYVIHTLIHWSKQAEAGPVTIEEWDASQLEPFLRLSICLWCLVIEINLNKSWTLRSNKPVRLQAYFFLWWWRQWKSEEFSTPCQPFPFQPEDVHASTWRLLESCTSKVFVFWVNGTLTEVAPQHSYLQVWIQSAKSFLHLCSTLYMVWGSFNLNVQLCKADQKSAVNCMIGLPLFSANPTARICQGSNFSPLGSCSIKALRMRIEIIQGTVVLCWSGMTSSIT